MLFNDPIREFVRDSVTEEAKLDVSEEAASVIWDALLTTLEMWKIKHGNRNPKTMGGNGLLGALGGVPIEFDQAKPWQCTDDLDSNATRLTLRLLYEKFPELMELQKKASEKKLLATLLIQDEGGDWDWFDAYRRYLHCQIPEAHLMGKLSESIRLRGKVNAADKQQAILANGRRHGVIARQAKAEEKKMNILAAIKSLFDTPSKPGWGWTNAVIVQFLVRSLDYPSGTIEPHVKTQAAKYRKERKEEQARMYLNR